MGGFLGLLAAPEAGCGHLVAAPEPLAVLVSELFGHVRITVFVAIGYVGPAVVVKVAPGAGNAVLKSAALNLAEALRGLVVIGVAAVLPGGLAGKL